MNKLNCPHFFDLVIRDEKFNLHHTMNKHRDIYDRTEKVYFIVMANDVIMKQPYPEPNISRGFLGMCHLNEFAKVVKKFSSKFDRPYLKDLAMEPLRNTMKRNDLKTTKNALNGFNITLTGVFKRWDRDEMKNIIEMCGGSVSDNIRVKKSPTDILVKGMSVGMTKMNMAKKHDVLIIDENEFLNMITS